MKVLVTGATGTLGSRLIPKLLAKGYRVFAIHRGRHPDIAGVEWLKGDITQPNLGIGNPLSIDHVYHLAGSVDLSPNSERVLVNASGTYRVCEFCIRHGVKHLHHISTSFLEGRNNYEKSKIAAEFWVNMLANSHNFGDGVKMLENPHPPMVTVYRPSVLFSNPSLGFLQAFNQYLSRLVAFAVRTHYKGERYRRKLEGKLRLPPLRQVFRLHGNPDALLDMVGVEDVASAIASNTETGIRYLTAGENAWKLKDLANIVGNVLGMDIEFETDNKEFSPVEKAFMKATKAFSPYLWQTKAFPTVLQTVDTNQIRQAIYSLFEV